MRWGDMDAYGHINNVNLVRMMEEARIAGFGVPGGTGKPGILPQVDLFSTVPENTQILVVEHRVRYVKPLDYRNVPAHVDLWISNIKAASFDICYEFHDPVDGGICVRATTTLAFFAVETQRLLRLSAEHKAALGAYEADRSSASVTPPCGHPRKLPRQLLVAVQEAGAAARLTEKQTMSGRQGTVGPGFGTYGQRDDSLLIEEAPKSRVPWPVPVEQRGWRKGHGQERFRALAHHDHHSRPVLHDHLDACGHPVLASMGWPAPEPGPGWPGSGMAGVAWRVVAHEDGAFRVLLPCSGGCRQGRFVIRTTREAWGWCVRRVGARKLARIS